MIFRAVFEMPDEDEIAWELFRLGVFEVLAFSRPSYRSTRLTRLWQPLRLVGSRQIDNTINLSDEVYHSSLTTTS